MPLVTTSCLLVSLNKKFNFVSIVFDFANFEKESERERRKEKIINIFIPRSVTLLNV